MIIRFPEKYSFPQSYIKEECLRGHSKKSIDKYNKNENETDDNGYSFDFADDEYVEEFINT